MKQRVYLDYAASTPVDPEVFRVMVPYFSEKYGNPGALHSFGQEAIKAVDTARETVANAVGADFREVIFTGSATEANNLALRGVVADIRRKLRRFAQNDISVDPRAIRVNPRPKLIVSAVEHESVLGTARDLVKDGVDVVVIPVSKEGIVDIEKLREALDGRTVLVSVMYVNNEIGTVEPIAKILEIVRKFREALSAECSTSSKKNQSRGDTLPTDCSTRYPLLHTDVAQAFQYFDCNVGKLGVDLLTLSGQKMYGPKGVGALYVRGRVSILSDKGHGSPRDLITPMITGGGQEYGLRSGTENTPLVAGLGKAVELAARRREKERARIAELRDYFLGKLRVICPGVCINGVGELRIANAGLRAAPHILNVYFPDYEAQDLLMRLDLEGIAVSTGAACSARSAKPSHVIRALGYDDGRAKRSVRFSFGVPTTKEELDRALGVIGKLIA